MHACPWRAPNRRRALPEMAEQGYEIVVDSNLPFAAALARVTELLKTEGFGILTEIDVTKTLREKLGAEFRPYRILGACNPKLALRVLEVEPGVGVLLPCNVVVEEIGDASRVRLMNPTAALALISNRTIEIVAQEATASLRRVAQQLEQEP